MVGTNYHRCLRHVLCSISPAPAIPPPPHPHLFCCLIVLSIVIVCNAEGRPEEQGRPRCQQCVRCLLPRGVCLICNIFNITPEAGGRSKGSVVTAAAVSAATVATIAADTNEIGSQRWQWWG
jgi:hypothetical protein